MSFTIGYGELHPKSFIEILFFIFFSIIGVSLYSYTISNLTSLFERLSENDNIIESRENAIREFANNHCLSDDLYNEIRNYLVYHYI